MQLSFADVLALLQNREPDGAFVKVAIRDE